MQGQAAKADCSSALNSSFEFSSTIYKIDNISPDVMAQFVSFLERNEEPRPQYYNLKEHVRLACEMKCSPYLQILAKSIEELWNSLYFYPTTRVVKMLETISDKSHLKSLLMFLPWYLVDSFYPLISFRKWIENALKNNPALIQRVGYPVYNQAPDAVRKRVNQNLVPREGLERNDRTLLYLQYLYYPSNGLGREACCELDVEGRIIRFRLFSAQWEVLESKGMPICRYNIFQDSV
jgi:hypothetical protein